MPHRSPSKLRQTLDAGRGFHDSAAYPGDLAHDVMAINLTQMKPTYAANRTGWRIPLGLGSAAAACVVGAMVWLSVSGQPSGQPGLSPTNPSTPVVSGAGSIPVGPSGSSGVNLVSSPSVVSPGDRDLVPLSDNPRQGLQFVVTPDPRPDAHRAPASQSAAPR